MREAVLASFYHHCSSDQDPQHDRCPPHTDTKRSWCFFKRWEAGEGDQDQPPPRVTKLPNGKEKIPFFFEVSDEMKARILLIFQDLTKTELLERCLSCATSNANESVHAKMWRKITKKRFAGRERVVFLADVMMHEHNRGYVQGNFLKELHLLPSPSKKRHLEHQQRLCNEMAKTEVGPGRR